MSVETIAIICAVLGVIGSLILWVAAILGVKSLRDIREFLRGRPGDRG
jgi:hypothetical protein